MTFPTRRIALAATLAIGLAAGWIAGRLDGPAQAADSPDLAVEARAALQSFFDATYSQDPARVAAILAPEFQLARSDGTGYGVDYAEHLPAFTKAAEITDIIATSDSDVLVVRYRVSIGVVIDGKMAEAVSPRLTVFRRDQGTWRVVAHANFARLEQ